MTATRTLLIAACAGGLLAACATAPSYGPGPGYGPPPPPPPAPPSEGAGGGGILRDWRGIITSRDRDRLNRIDAAWSRALEQARRSEGSGDLASVGDLIEKRAGGHP